MKMKKTMFDIVIPRLSEKIIDCQVARWMKNEGDYVLEGEVLVELETEKTTIEIESPCEGVLTGIYVFEGEEVIDGERVGIINAEEVFGDFDEEDDDDEFDDELDEQLEDDELDDEDLDEDELDEDDEFEEDLEELEEIDEEDTVYNRYPNEDD
jgi:2-oxoglutarate dehydrogenase E2 component (dihydrolipoamide succinyltransferase)